MPSWWTDDEHRRYKAMLRRFRKEGDKDPKGKAARIINSQRNMKKHVSKK